MVIEKKRKDLKLQLVQPLPKGCVCYGFLQQRRHRKPAHVCTNSHIAVRAGCTERPARAGAGFGPPSVVGICDSNFRTPVTDSSPRGWRGPAWEAQGLAELNQRVSEEGPVS